MNISEMRYVQRIREVKGREERRGKGQQIGGGCKQFLTAGREV